MSRFAALNEALQPTGYSLLRTAVRAYYSGNIQPLKDILNEYAGNPDFYREFVTLADGADEVAAMQTSWFAAAANAVKAHDLVEYFRKKMNERYPQATS